MMRCRSLLARTGFDFVLRKYDKDALAALFGQWGIAELVDRIHVRSVSSEKRHGLTESLDGQEMSQRVSLCIQPALINSGWADNNSSARGRLSTAALINSPTSASGKLAIANAG